MQAISIMRSGPIETALVFQSYTFAFAEENEMSTENNMPALIYHPYLFRRSEPLEDIALVSIEDVANKAFSNIYAQVYCARVFCYFRGGGSQHSSSVAS